MSDEEIKKLVEQFRIIAREEAQNILKKSVQVVPAKVISVSETTATVRLITSTDSSSDFSVPITTSQTILQGDYVNIGYWNNLSTAIILSK